MVTMLPSTPLPGSKPEIIGVADTATVKFPDDSAVPPGVVTATFPVVAPAGTVAVIWVALSTVNVLAELPLNATVVAPVNRCPEIVTTVPAFPLLGVKLLTVGVVTTGGGGGVELPPPHETIDKERLRTSAIRPAPMRFTNSRLTIFHHCFMFQIGMQEPVVLCP